MGRLFRKKDKRIKEVKIKKPHKERFPRLKAFYTGSLAHRVLVLFLLSMADMLIIESLARHSLIAGIVFMCTHPLVFLFNSCIIFVTYAVGLLMRR